MLSLPVSVLAAAIVSQETPARSDVIQNTGNIAFGERLVVRRTPDGIERVEATRPGPAAAIPVQPTNGVSGNPLVTTQSGTIAFGLGGSRETGSILRVENATDGAIAYDAYIVRFVGGQTRGPDRTNVCTVPAGLAAFETWPEPVVQVVIGNVWAAEGDVAVCEPASVAD